MPRVLSTGLGRTMVESAVVRSDPATREPVIARGREAQIENGQWQVCGGLG